MKVNEICENISHTSKRLRDIERKKGVKPGTQEWFKLWFSLPYLKESLLHEGYKIRLERGKDMDVLHIVDTKTNKRTEVRGKSGYETAYDPECPLHQLLDKIGKAANISELMNGEVVSINPKHPDSERANAETDRAFNEDVSVPENVFHMKNRLLKVKQITDAMRNRPLMFRSFVHDGEPIARIIKKVTNDSARSIKTGSNEKQNEVLEKLGISHPTFAAMANSKYANVRRDSLEDMEVWGMQNIFIPMSNEIYYSDAIEDLGMGRKSIGRNIAVQSDFDVDEAVATYKKGWPPANFNNEIIVDTKEYYLLNLRSFLLELTSPEIKDRIKRLKSMYDKSYEKRAEENHINDIMKDIFKTKITTYSDISNWISNVAVPFVDMLAANRGEPTNNDDYDDDDDDWFDYNIDIDDYDNDDELKLESDSSKANTATSTAFNEDAEVDLHGNAERGYVLSKISVSADQRGQGRGTEIMQQIVDRMDKEGAIIALTPDTVFGGAKGKLIDFYKRFGFVPNKGRNKDFRFRETMIRYPKQINEENIYDILEPEDCGPFDGGCVLVAQALQQIHGGDIVVLVNDKGIADHAAVKVGNTLIDYDGPLPAEKFVKRFEKNELVNITGIRSMKPSDLPGATRNQSLVPKIVNLLSKKKKYKKVNEETGKEMLKIFRGMHHDAGMNKDMDAFIRSHDWELRDFTPDMFPSEEEFFDYDDPFDRIIDIDYSHRVDLSQPIIVGPQYSDGKYSVIDGNHRAAAAQRAGKTIKGYFPVKKITEAEGLGLTIFDIDETLMRTTAQIKVVKDGKTVRSLTNQEFNNYELQPGEEFDFGEFRNAEKFARESEPIGPMIAKLKAILRNAGDSKVIMLTARSDFDDKETFLDTFRKLGIDMSRVHVHRAGNLPGNPAENKEVFIRQYLDTGKYSRIRLYDDSMGNIRMFNALAKEYPDVQFYPYLVAHDGSTKTVRENDSNKVVTELLNTQAKDAKWTMSSEDMSRMEFTASNGIVYEIDFLAPYIGPDEIYPTDFVDNMSREQIDQAVFIEFSQKGATGQAKQGVAGTGAAAEVFGIVTNAILEFARKRKPSMLYFQAAEPNRQKLYAAIVNRLVKSMPGYTVKRIGGKFAVYSNNIGENFADGKKPGRKGLAKRMGVDCSKSTTELRKIAKNSSGEKQRMAHWCANMKSGKKK